MLSFIHHRSEGTHIILLRELEGQHLPTGPGAVVAGWWGFLHEHLAHHLARSLDVHHHLHVLHEVAAVPVLEVPRLQGQQGTAVTRECGEYNQRVGSMMIGQIP
jgi:hypothetical protein